MGGTLVLALFVVGGKLAVGEVGAVGAEKVEEASRGLVAVGGTDFEHGDTDGGQFPACIRSQFGPDHYDHGWCGKGSGKIEEVRESIALQLQRSEFIRKDEVPLPCPFLQGLPTELEAFL